MGNSKTKTVQPDSKEINDNDNNNTPSLYPQLQIRNCIRNVRSNSNNFTEMFPNEAGASCGQASSVYTIDVHHTTPANFTNPGYVSTEGLVKRPSNDGLPSYEEAIGGVKSPVTSVIPTIQSPPPPPASSSSSSIVDVINEDNSNRSRGRRHRHRRHGRHHHQQQPSDTQNENSEPRVPDEHRRHHHRRGLRKHFAKMKRRNRSETE